MSATKQTVETIDRPFAGHFIGSADCRFFRTTDVGEKWRVSTVGDYHPSGLPDVGAHEIGYQRLYETMVFQLGRTICDCGCGAPEVSSWTEKDFKGYGTQQEAETGHASMVAKYRARVRRK